MSENKSFSQFLNKSSNVGRSAGGFANKVKPDNNTNNVQNAGSGFSNKFNNHLQPTSSEDKKFADSLKGNARPSSSFMQKEEKRANKIYLERGIDDNREVWYYMQIDKDKERDYLNHPIGQPINLGEFGKILFSGYGKNPPDEIVKKIEEEYGG